jgi:hypothetical protein
MSYSAILALRPWNRSTFDDLMRQCDDTGAASWRY